MRSAVALMLGLGIGLSSVHATPIAQFPAAPGVCLQPFALALDTGGDAWFGCAGQNVLVRLRYVRVPYVAATAQKSSGTTVTTIVNLPAGIHLSEIAVFDGGGNLWLSTHDDTVVRYAPASATTTVFPLPPGNRFIGIGPAADGRIWLSAYDTNKVLRLDPATGTHVEFAFARMFHPYRVVAGPDGTIWVGSYSTYLARVTPGGAITEYDVGGAVGLALGPDGKLWHASQDFVGRFDPATATDVHFPVPSPTSMRDLAVAPDGTLWWAGLDDGGGIGRIGQITPQGDPAPVTMPGTSKSAYSLAIRQSDGQVFYADPNAAEIGAIDPAFATPPDATVVEFHNSILNHYFLTANPEEAAGIDAGTAGPGWSRTGKSFKAWLAGPIPQAGRLCRFYGTPGRGPNSHFFTISSEECAIVLRDPGWTPEAAGRFWLVPPAAGCPPYTERVLRAYNNRFAFNDSNHRYTTDNDTYSAMLAAGWIGEGGVFCAPR